MGYWNRLKANWYRRGLDYSGLSEAALKVMLPRLAGVKTILDVGAGCGTLAIPLAREGFSVTALEPSIAMLDILKAECRKEGIRKIKAVNASWGEAPVKPHDAILCANVPELLKEPEAFIKGADALAKKAVFLIVNAGPDSDKFYYRELYPLLFKKEWGPRSDYLKTYAALHGMGIFANAEIISYNFDQPFDGIDEAVAFWREYLGIVTGEHDAALTGFLKKKLVKKGKILLARFNKKSAVIWWRKR
ncbi:MAG: methyltransferase domain-containing protein [Deltaproteobacteria bacterium]|nr:methyltransferase domain-containing protein [Deltaproteobacteria bacterium]